MLRARGRGNRRVTSDPSGQSPGPGPYTGGLPERTGFARAATRRSPQVLRHSAVRPSGKRPETTAGNARRAQHPADGGLVAALCHVGHMLLEHVRVAALPRRSPRDLLHSAAARRAVDPLHAVGEEQPHPGQVQVSPTTIRGSDARSTRTLARRSPPAAPTAGLTPVGADAHDQRPEQRAEDRPAPPEERDATDHHGRDAFDICQLPRGRRDGTDPPDERPPGKGADHARQAQLSLQRGAAQPPRHGSGHRRAAIRPTRKPRPAAIPSAVPGWERTTASASRP